jgi:hypothetical protein
MDRGSLKWMRFSMMALLAFITFAVSWNLLADMDKAELKKPLQDTLINNHKVFSNQSPLFSVVQNNEESLAKSEYDFVNSNNEKECFTKEEKESIQKTQDLALKSSPSDMQVKMNGISPSESQRDEAPDCPGLIASLSDITGYSIPFDTEFFYSLDETRLFADISYSHPTSGDRSNVEKEGSLSGNPKLSQTQEQGKGLVIESSEEDGIRVEDALCDGVNIVKAHRGLNVGHAYGEGMKVNFAHSDGFYVDSADVNGLDIDHVGDDGIQIFRAGKDGLVIYNASEEGIDAIGDRGNLLRSNSPNFHGLCVYSYGASPSNPGLYVAGTFFATGTKSCVVQTSRGDEALYAIESPEVEFVASGTGKLVNGECFVTFDRLFQEAVSKEIPLRIILTPKDAWSGLYVAEKSHQRFQVKTVDGEKDVQFDWLAIGRRKGYENRPESPFLKDASAR